ncbi:unnamed protein product [Prorocentrum cordatum]|uniref:Uncharacterized protein n=1 Tax=Prorocentrum cordatum TaxID=2364126 RepID=A0ABN9XWT5_9DINO|nr:unnamed protein product [Polarella glacialis]
MTTTTALFLLAGSRQQKKQWLWSFSPPVYLPHGLVNNALRTCRTRDRTKLLCRKGGAPLLSAAAPVRPGSVAVGACTIFWAASEARAQAIIGGGDVGRGMGS